MHDRLNGEYERDAPSLAVKLVVATFVAVGLVARLAPLFDRGGRLLRQFPTEDGYLMLTIARNLARGLGMSTAEGMIPTNGTQPLATFLWSTAYWLVDADKVAGVRLVLLMQVGIACLSAWLIFRLGAQLLRGYEEPRACAALGAAAWFASPCLLQQSMNCLETGLYGLLLLVVFSLLFSHESESRAFPYRRWGPIGAALGIGFWARNDIVLLALALALVHLTWGLEAELTSRRTRFVQLTRAGLVMSAISAPWLVFNVLRFGHLMPISGQAEALDAAFGANLPLVLPNLLESVLLMVPVPHVLKERWEFVLLCLLVLAAGVRLGVVHVREVRAELRAALRLLAVFTLLMCAFYGLYFGAGHFLSRYFFALSPLVAVVWGALLWLSLRWLAEHHRRLLPVLTVALVLLPVALQLRNYERGATHQHFQAVQWVEQHVGDNEWVGAIQSGTVGYFHGRTINLDGKVNPAALAARRAQAIPEYVAESSIGYLVDWYTITQWSKLPAIERSFRIAVARPDDNLAVLRRRDEEDGRAAEQLPGTND